MKKYILLFDFDGTLVDSMPCFSKTMYRVLDDSAIPYPKNIIEILTPLGYVGSAEYMIKTLGAKDTAENLISKMYTYAYEGYANEIVLKDGVKEFLIAAKKLGYSLNVLTASPHKMLDVCLKRNGVWELFDRVWSCEDFNTTKADTNIYVRAAKELSVTVDKVAFFDDNLHAVETAKQAGAFTFGVYDESGKAFAAQLKSVSHLYLETLKDADKVIFNYIFVCFIYRYNPNNPHSKCECRHK